MLAFQRSPLKPKNTRRAGEQNSTHYKCGYRQRLLDGGRSMPYQLPRQLQVTRNTSVVFRGTENEIDLDFFGPQEGRKRVQVGYMDETGTTKWRRYERFVLKYKDALRYLCELDWHPNMCWCTRCKGWTILGAAKCLKAGSYSDASYKSMRKTNDLWSKQQS